jgi:hypothetical protein
MLSKGLGPPARVSSAGRTLEYPQGNGYSPGWGPKRGDLGFGFIHPQAGGTMNVWWNATPVQATVASRPTVRLIAVRQRGLKRF